MAKHKNKTAAIRREAKKRKKAIKRKAHARTATLRKSQPEYLTEYVYSHKLSEVILDYAEPLINAAGGSEGEEKAIRMSIILWNASLFPKEKALETIEPVFNEMANGDQLTKGGFYTIFELMYNRKQSLFSDDKRLVVDYSLEKNKDGFYLQVASTPFQTATTRSPEGSLTGTIPSRLIA